MVQKARVNLYWLPLFSLLLLGLGACRLDANHEIWLADDESGRARVEASVVLPNIDEENNLEESLGEENALEELAARIRETPGAEITALDYETNKGEEEISVLYYLEFTFDSVETLRKIICIEADKGISIERKGKDKILKIDPRQLYMQASEDNEEYYGLIDMNMALKINLPTKAKEVTPEYQDFKKQRNLSWAFVLDEEWYTQPDRSISVKY